MSDRKISRALISVTDKTGVVELARALHEEFGVEIISTGGTARVLSEAGVPVTPVEDVTGFPEMMDGRVKTLHPKIYGGLLARRDDPGHLEAATAQGIDLIDLVVVNLYNFSQAVEDPDVAYADAIEQIDIGGPSMIRAAAKNHDSVTVVTSSEVYGELLDDMREHEGATCFGLRQHLAVEAFALTCMYDMGISVWLGAQMGVPSFDEMFGPDGDEDDEGGQTLDLFFDDGVPLRYGENPHQNASFFSFVSPESWDSGVASDFGAPLTAGFLSGEEPLGSGEVDDLLFHSLAEAEVLQGKELSYNNYLDLDAAWAAVREFAEPSCVIVKHLTPCGIATNDYLVEAYKRAHDNDPVSAYGGVMAFNRQVTAGVIKAMRENDQFVEAIIAPDFEQQALELLADKPNIRALQTGGCNPPGWQTDYRSIEGGMLAMSSDSVAAYEGDFKAVSKREPSDAEREQLLFAWRCCKSVKSNAIVIAKDFATVGIGGGQPNRVNSARIAVEQAGAATAGAVAASDAFMPFADSMEALVAAGVTAVIQPGGSMRDDEVIAAADAAGVALVFTGYRHFRH
ncbi:MAG: bifunctional phosphoribosylaminoimidazolecarboxamide formyltransferase/inosine monophosphate cyclohydrolase [Coriobacteriia bacterium]|nr:bifunctional phosphoribosylaminoimidazolecarboxamide formyltransferase/inosine monophosphate cyclohydrolase [Coriobacteriia bacterium]